MSGAWGRVYFNWLHSPFQGRRLIDFSKLEPRLCPYWSLIPSPVSSAIKSSLNRRYGPLLMNATSLPTTPCCIHYAVCLWCFLTSFLTFVYYISTPVVVNAQSHLNNNGGIDLDFSYNISKGIPQFIKHKLAVYSPNRCRSMRIASPAARFEGLEPIELLWI